EAHATDSAGNKSITPKVELDVDATANAPVINAVNDDVDSHTGNVLDAKTKVALTNDSTPTLEGYAEPNSVVTIYEISELSGDKRAIGTTTADKHGGWKFELPQLEDGEYQYTTRIQDKAGNISDFSETVVVNVDLVAPSEPTIIFVEDINKKDGKLNKAENGKDGDNASTTAQISVPGDAEENDVIHYTVNGEEKTHTITYNDRVAGYIEVKVPVVDGKTSTVTAKIVDQAGNSSEIVKESISSDFTAPNVQITGIIDNVPGGTYKDNVAGTSTNDNKPTIKGTTDANQEVVIYDTDKEIGRVKADKDGNWEFKPIDYKEPLADLVGRVHIIKAVVTDAAGNSSEATSALEVDTTVGTPKVKFKEDLNSNEVLSVEEAKALTDGKLHWIVEIPTDGISVKAGDTLQVYGKNAKWQNAAIITNDDIAKGFVERDGFVMDLPKGNGAQSPAYRIVDIVGNESEGNFANLVYDKELTRQPSNPSIKFPEDNDPKDGKISDKENKAGDGDAGKTTAEISIPKDGSVKPGDKLIVTDDNGKETVRPIEQSDIDKGSIDVPVELNPGKDNTIIAEIVNPNNPDNPGKGKGVIGENSEATKAPEAPVITDVIDDVEGGKFNQSVKGGLTNDNTPTIKGTVKAGSTVIIYDNGVEIGRIENANANWEFTTPVLTKQGEHKFTAIAKNEFGESGSSNEATIELDTIAPSVENVKATPIDMSNPADSTPEKGRVEGSSDTPGAIVVIKDQAGKEIIGSGKVGNDGKFSIETTRPINTGDKVTVEITDKAGNTGKGEAEAGSVKHEGDSAAPCDPTITFVEDINPEDGKLNKVENSKDGDNASTKARISFLPDVVKGDVIKYTINNGNEQNHTVTADDVKAGYIEIKVPVVDGQTSTITAKIVDQAGNASKEVSGSIDVDTTAPNTPVITAVIDEWYGGVEFDNVLGKDKGLTNDNTPKFKGTAEAGSTIVLKNGNEIIGEDIEVKANGTWEFTPKTPLADGEYNVTATATDKAGNVSNPSNVATINVDTNCAKPVITEIIDDVAGGAVNGDVKFGLTNDNLPTLKGTAEAFAEVKFMIDGRPVFKDGKQVSVTADENGKWEYTLEANSNWGGKVHVALEDGRHTFEAQATDKAGNNSQPSDVVSVDVDTTARAPKVMITADKDDNSILTATEASALTDGKLKWVIKLPEDAKVGDRIEVANSHREWVTILTLSAADIAKGEVARDDFSADFVKGKPGFETPSYRIVDQAGNVSTEHWDTVKFDKAAPTAPVIKEVVDDHKGYDDDTRVGNVLDVKDGLTNDNMPTIKGTAEAGIKVNIYDNGKWIGDAKADANGNWNFTPSTSVALPDGKHSITAVAENALGVNSKPSNVANIDVDTVTPKPTIEKITDNVEGGVYQGDVKGGLTNDNRPVFEGKAEKGAFVELFDNGKVIGTTEAGEDGKWTIQPKEPMADGRHDMVVQATDLAGNRSRSDQTSSDVDTTPGVVKITAVCDDVAGYNGKVGNILGVNNGLTNDSTPTIKGTSKPGTTITIKDGDKVIEGDVKYGADGSWEFTPKTPLAEGKHELTAIATSKTGAQSVSNKAAIDVDTKIADAKVEFIEDTNNDGKFSWKENIDNTHTGRLSWKALIPDDGSVKAGDIFHYKWDETGWHERTISQAEIDRGYIGEMKNNQIGKDQPDAGKLIPYGKNANGSVYVAEAFFSDAAGNKGAKGSDKIVFDFSDSETGAKTVNVKITSIDDNVPGWNGKTGNIITNEAAHIAGLTNDNTPTISGTTEAGAIVKVSIVNSKTHKVWESDVKANENGEWSITTGNIADGKYSVVAVATDKSGVASSPYTVSGLEIDTTVAKPNIWVAEDRNHDGFYDNAEYYNPANGKGDITFVVEVPKDGSVKVGDTFHYTLNTDYKGWSSINGYGENITISQADIDNGSFSRVVTLCKDNQHFDLRHDGATVSMKGQFKDLAGNALADETSVKFDLTKVHSGKVRSTRSLPDDILDNDSVDLSNAARINEPKAEPNVLNNNKIGVSANDLLETPKDHIMNEGKSEAKPSYATASSHAGEENIATTHPIQIEEKVENHF
ncbi:Ig-like domain-containing protein, partial [Campylobacter concisus]